MRHLTLLLILFLFSYSIGQAQTPNESRKKRIELPFTTLEKAGFKRDSIERILDDIATTSRKDFRGLVVIKNNHIVIEEYYNTFMRNTIHDIRSAGKSVTALLLGVAIKEGLIESLEQDIYSLFSPKNNAAINKDYQKITLRNLLDMSSGLDADTDDSQTYGHAGKWIEKDDWKDYLLNAPLKNQPGKNWVYADLNPLLIGLAIEEASGMSLRDYAQQKLFDPLGIEQVYWYTNSANQTGAAGNLYITTLDFAKLGMLITNEGKWGSQQIIPENYVEVLISSKTYRVSHWFSLADSYGMLWYKSAKTFGNKSVEYLFASGNGGNQLIVIPEEEMVIALTASAYGQGYAHGRTYAIMEKIIAAMK